MKQHVVNEQQFQEVLFVWKRAGRSLITLPNISKGPSGLRVSMISIDNTVQYIYEQEFKTYKMLLSWFGGLIDRVN
ncbi:MAG: hypothetical protein NWQ54_21815 [Paraglaciecola sp.]|nr:hypothetical protein [Paraglaciecola sp.]